MAPRIELFRCRYFAPHRQVVGNLGHVFAIAGSPRRVVIAGLAP